MARARVDVLGADVVTRATAIIEAGPPLHWLASKHDWLLLMLDVVHPSQERDLGLSNLWKRYGRISSKFLNQKAGASADWGYVPGHQADFFGTSWEPVASGAVGTNEEVEKKSHPSVAFAQRCGKRSHRSPRRSQRFFTLPRRGGTGRCRSWAWSIGTSGPKQSCA